MTVHEHGIEPVVGASLTPLAIPLYIDAGPVKGIALALSRDTAGLYYLVDNALPDGPPVWVHEGQIERCEVAPLGHARSAAG
jgi:hypothetical protein